MAQWQVCEAFAQAGNYPRFKDNPADYSAVDAAIAKAKALKKDDYKDFSAVETAVNDVARGKNFTEQADVDAMAQAIENAIAALQYKEADYTKVAEAIAKANALNKNSYQDFSAVEKAIAAVVRDKNITQQSEVDAMAQAIRSAGQKAFLRWRFFFRWRHHRRRLQQFQQALCQHWQDRDCHQARRHQGSD